MCQINNKRKFGGNMAGSQFGNHIHILMYVNGHRTIYVF